MKLTPPRLAVLRRMQPGEVRLFDPGHDRRGSWSGASDARSKCHTLTGKFNARNVLIVELRTGESTRATMVTREEGGDA